MDTTRIIRIASSFVKRNKAISVAALVLAFGIAAFVGQCGCKTAGVADPAVRENVETVVDLLNLAYEFSDDSNAATEYLDRALEAARYFKHPTMLDKLTEEDLSKVNRLIEGLESIKSRVDTAAYVRQRSKSLSELANSIGLYDNQETMDEVENAADNYEEYFDNEPEETE